MLFGYDLHLIQRLVVDQTHGHEIAWKRERKVSISFVLAKEIRSRSSTTIHSHSISDKWVSEKVTFIRTINTRVVQQTRKPPEFSNFRTNLLNYLSSLSWRKCRARIWGSCLACLTRPGSASCRWKTCWRRGARWLWTARPERWTTIVRARSLYESIIQAIRSRSHSHPIFMIGGFSHHCILYPNPQTNYAYERKREEFN